MNKASNTPSRSTYLVCGDHQLAEEAVQEAFARALERWARLGGEPWALGWVITTALNFARRSRKARVLPPLAESRSSVDLDAAIDLRVAVGALPSRQQEAILLFYLADLPLAEVARSMRCRTGTAKAHLARARRKLAQIMEEESHEER
jgi:RNA polymerase sigma-70 factor (ECF subfamily)